MVIYEVNRKPGTFQIFMIKNEMGKKDFNCLGIYTLMKPSRQLIFV